MDSQVNNDSVFDVGVLNKINNSSAVLFMPSKIEIESPKNNRNETRLPYAFPEPLDLRFTTTLALTRIAEAIVKNAYFISHGQAT